MLVRDIEFLMDESIEIEKKVKYVISFPSVVLLPFLTCRRDLPYSVVARPWVKSEPDMGNQMPLYLRRVPP